ncbi:hypothetical protein BWZ20_04540 [Winogradskyella sp. J14-2]|uniref:hypothetical protein n=1 Tax=Winogradskyella sp. J14-2 TaxID=1936080 RepID=UPI000972BB2C|nr:hypothetical protein [Winogradskyella sp. J14-2]APY07610.1 hypothetical protein BWZ20_04540 [Winogradskyella sp. J14-2]
MKKSYLLILIIFFSCKKQHNQTPQKVEEVVEFVEANDIEASATKTKTDASQLTLKEVLEETSIKTLPHIETTNFDDFIDPDDYKDIDAQLFKLETIYPNFYKEGHNYRAIRIYSLPLHEDYFSVVITIEKGENEMESVLVNYTKDGELIDHAVVSYDEIAEGWSRRVSRISKHTLTTNYITWFDDKEIEQTEYRIKNDGKIEKVNSEYLHKTIADYHVINAVLEQFDLKWIQLKTNRITSRTYIENPEETIVVLPRVTDEEEGYTQLNVDVVVADNDLENNNRKYFKSEEPMALTSDAIRLNAIKIDATPYQISEATVAFGITEHYIGSSRVNPYENEKVSLYIKSGNALKNVMKSFSVLDSGGEWDGECIGQFAKQQKTLTVSTEKTNGYLDILVNNTITETKHFEDENGECQYSESINTQASELKFQNGNYIEYKEQESTVIGVRYSKFQPKKIEALNIPDFQVNSGHALNSYKVLSAYKDNKDEKDTNWGDRLLILNEKNDILYESTGVGDPYLFQPHFYKNNTNNKTIIICQMAFEYPFGGEAFLLENGTIKHMGTLDIEGYNPEQSSDKYLTEIIKINEYDNVITFSFKADSLVLNPSKDETIIKNDNVKYVYNGNKLVLKRD